MKRSGWASVQGTVLQYISTQLGDEFRLRAPNINIQPRSCFHLDAPFKLNESLTIWNDTLVSSGKGGIIQWTGDTFNVESQLTSERTSHLDHHKPQNVLSINKTSNQKIYSSFINQEFNS